MKLRQSAPDPRYQGCTICISKIQFVQMIERQAFALAQKLAAGFPVLALTGPRQSGKTTLARQAFAGKPYFSFEDPEVRQRFDADPRQIGRAHV